MYDNMDRNQTKYKIKTATEKEILAHLMECNNSFSPPLSERIDLKQYSQKIFKKSITFEAWRDHLLVGLIAAYFDENFGNSAFITNVSVMKGFTGLGIASELLNKCIGYARKKHFREIELEVNKDNDHAINLYRKFDFISDGTRDDFLKMKIEISK
jgi:ribosomal protein S18 acetylase RimI-like enzyme